jgi:hypothetical protein
MGGKFAWIPYWGDGHGRLGGEKFFALTLIFQFCKSPSKTRQALRSLLGFAQHPVAEETHA